MLYKDVVTGVAFTIDAKQIISTGLDKSVKLTDISSKKTVKSFDNVHPGERNANCYIN